MKNTIYILFLTLIFVIDAAYADLDSIYWVNNNTIIATSTNSIKLIDINSKQILKETWSANTNRRISRDKTLFAYTAENQPINIADAKTLKILKSLENDRSLFVLKITKDRLIIRNNNETFCHSLNWKTSTHIIISKSDQVSCPKEPSNFETIEGKYPNEQFIFGNLTLSEIPYSDNGGSLGLQIIDNKTKKEITSVHEFVLPDCIVPSPNATKLAFIYKGNILLWHVYRKSSYKFPLKSAYTKNSNEYGISPHATYLYLIENDNNEVEYTIVNLKTLNHVSSFSSAADTSPTQTFSWDEKYFVSGCGQTIDIFEVLTGRKIASRPVHSDDCRLKAMPDNMILVVSSDAVVDILTNTKTKYTPSSVDTSDTWNNAERFPFHTPNYTAEKTKDGLAIADNMSGTVKINIQLCSKEYFGGMLPDNKSFGITEFNCDNTNHPVAIYDVVSKKITAMAPNRFKYSANNQYVIWPNINSLEVWPADPATWPLEVIYSPVHFTEKDRCKDDGYECP